LALVTWFVRHHFYYSDITALL